MHFAKPYACKQTTAFGLCPHPICSDILLRQSDIMQCIVILLVSLVVIFYLLKVNYLLAKPNITAKAITLSLLNRTCKANRTEKPQPNSVEVFLGAGRGIRTPVAFGLTVFKTYSL